MLTKMRTTLVIDDKLMEQAKKQAAERKSSVSAVVNEALRESLRRSKRVRQAPKFSMPTFGGTRQSQMSAADMKALVDDDL